MRAPLPRHPAHGHAFRLAGRCDGHPGAAAAATARMMGDGGAALAELAVTLPFLAVLVIGCLDFGRAFALKGRATNMAREGAFRAQNHPTNIDPSCSPSITTAALAEDRGVDGAVVTVIDAGTGAVLASACNGAPTGAARVRVEITVPMTVYTPFAGSFLGDQIQIRASTTVAVQA